MRIFILFLFLPFSVKPQFYEQFTDGELSKNPSWFGDTNDYKVNLNFELQLDASSSGSSEIICPSRSISNARWVFDITMDFNPSSSNYSIVYLVLSEKIISSSEGYFLLIGGGEDKVSLFYKDSSYQEVIIDGQNKRINTNPVDLQIIVERDSTGLWSLSHDDGNGLVYEGSNRHDSLKYSSYFGIQCNYTSTRSDKFYFDNILITGAPFLDTLSPKVIHHQLINSGELRISFNEPLEMTSVANRSNYKFIEGNPGIDSIILDSGKYEITILLNNSLPDNDRIGLTVQNLEDSVGNKLNPTTLYFDNPVYSLASYRQILVNEIMSDPEPSVNLPEIEYVELWNTTNNRFRTIGWKISDLTDTVQMSNAIIEPHKYIILCDQDDSLQLSSYGKILPIKDFPSLNNSFDKITLFDSTGSVIDSITYHNSWIINDEKRKGGWSIERNSPHYSCSSNVYWSASTSGNGGTPGVKNSNFIEQPNPIPYLRFLGTLLDQSFVFRLIGNTDLKQLISEIKISLDDELLIGELNIKRDSIIFNYSEKIDVGSHKLVISGLQDCFNNILEPRIYQISIPDHPKRSKLVINEILFNPKGEGSDFIEIYNLGTTPQNLYHFSLGGFKNDSIDEILNISDSTFILPPNRYVVISEDSLNIISSYPTSSSGIQLQCKLPPMNNSEGSVSLICLDSLIERVDYTEEMHFELLSNPEGVTLERISPMISSQNTENWHSASENSNYGTPGTQNSQYTELSEIHTNFSIHPEIISPDNDGLDDILDISYKMENTGYLARIRIIDRHGREVTEIVNSYQLSREGHILWDGLDEKGQVPMVGIYFLLIETYKSGMQLNVERIPLVIGQKWN